MELGLEPVVPVVVAVVIQAEPAKKVVDRAVDLTVLIKLAQ